jgi:hypothetical protein
MECHGVSVMSVNTCFNLVVFHPKPCFVMHDSNVQLNPDYANL